MRFMRGMTNRQMKEMQEETFRLFLDSRKVFYTSRTQERVAPPGEVFRCVSTGQRCWREKRTSYFIKSLHQHNPNVRVTFYTVETAWGGQPHTIRPVRAYFAGRRRNLNEAWLAVKKDYQLGFFPTMTA